MAETILDLLAQGRADDPAVLAPGKRSLTFGELRAHAGRIAATLAAHGVGPGDRVAIALPNGPRSATAFLAVASCATAAPLNPALSARELEFSLRDLGARVLLLPEAEDGVLRRVAESIGLPVLGLRGGDGGPAGWFELAGQRATAGDASVARSGPDDVALVLQTSGTTSRPKTVPLRQRNLAASAHHVGEALRLAAADRCLNVMPLFHIHGLVACLLAPLSAGGGVYCTAGFNPLRFFADLSESGATWWSAVPTMHQAVLARAARNTRRIAGSRLRFIRSSSSPLPPSVARELESVFGVPVIEAYGMTEAAHQVASNPLPPGARRPGSVGPAAGPDVAIMDDRGNLLPPGSTGEIAVRGPNVFDGYEARPDANAESFVDGWFRTGDQGVMDGDGYITLTGRLKEIINRGGEKISPREIDEALLEHGAVRQAVAFGIPHPLLGEDVGAAVVLKEGARVTERELRAFLAERLAAFKVPATLRIVEDVPRGATGKVRRLEMARQLGLA
jgi:acyl-CoA synthetase (AMP-forming)/AMP-acid ligase II